MKRYVQLQLADLTVSKNSPRSFALKAKHKVRSIEEYEIALKPFLNQDEF